MERSGKAVRKACYACNRTACTREHVPPISFFPPEYRRNLMTVPSCHSHNNANSKDVEYVRGVLLSLSQLGPNSKPVFDAMMRSIDRRPNIVGTMFQDLRPVRVDGYETGSFCVDLPRFDRVMTAIARAIHFRDFNEKRRYWDVFCPHFYLAESVSLKHDAFAPLRRAVTEPKYTWARTESTEVFCYGRAGNSPSRSVYQFVFYGSFVCFMWPDRHPWRRT